MRADGIRRTPGWSPPPGSDAGKLHREQEWTAVRLPQEAEAGYRSRGFGDLWQAIGEARHNGALRHNGPLPRHPHVPGARPVPQADSAARFMPSASRFR
jgi:hypothetical protein